MELPKTVLEKRLERERLVFLAVGAVFIGAVATR